MSSFESFNLNSTMLANLAEMGFTSPTEIQAQIMPLALEGGDVSGLSRTGTGKTAAFLIPTIHRLTELPEDSICLCLAPTRELAQQIEQEAKRISKDLGLGTVSIVGGMSSEDQIDALKKGARIVTGTPGRVIDLFKERALNLSKVAVLVFDEADRMFDMGFIKDMHYLLGKINPQRQILLFSATMNFSVLNMIYEYGANPQEINVSRDMLTAANIQQVLYHVSDREKPAALVAVCRKHAGENGSIIVFVNYKERVPWVAALLARNGIPAQGLSSLLRQERRNKIISGFKKGQFRALVATDVASRGLDVDDVSLVVNYHLPEEAATYVHRIGRTARAGRHGIAVAVCSSEDAYNQMRVEEFLGDKIPVEWLNEEDMPKDVKFPGRGDEREFEDDEGGEEAGSERTEARGEGRGRRDGGRGRGERGGRGRGERGERGGRDRGGRDRERDREPREAREPQREQPAEGAAEAQAPAEPPRSPREDRPQREGREGREGRERDRGPREPREPRESRERSQEPRREARDGGRDRDRGERGGRRRGGRDRDRRGERGRDRDHSESREAAVDPSSLPSPLTGNPVIYDARTGKPKNRSEAEVRRMLDDYSGKLGRSDEKSGIKRRPPAIIQKISSRVTALFGKRGE